MEPETRFASTPEGEVGYQVFGDGPIDLLYVASWRWNIDAMWLEPRIERFFTHLASFSRVIVFDKRGTGISDPVPLGALPTLEQWTDDIGAVLDAVDSERAAILGHGDGSIMAMLYAAAHPDRASALVVLDGLASGLQREDHPSGLPPHLLDRMTDAWRDGGHRLRIVAPSLEADAAFVRRIERFWRLSLPPAAYVRMFRWIMQLDIRAVLPTIRVPTLVLHRTGDRLVPVDSGRYVADHIPGATFVELPGDDFYFFVGDQDSLLDEIQGFLTGVRGSPEIDRILSTVMFTDIVGSTDRAAELGDRRWREALDVHDLTVRKHIEHFRGRRIKTTGDGVLATFDGPARAIRCARAIGNEVRQKLGIEVRAGLHTGEVELREEDIGGIAVALAARVMAEAGPSEVLVSSTVKDLVIGSGIEFDDRGSHPLKGVPGEWRLYAVKA